MGSVDWKSKAKELALLHEAQGVGGSVVPLRVGFAPVALDVVEATEIVGIVKGATLTPKQIRDFLFHARDQPGMTDQEGAIYAIYDEERDESCVGVGIMRSVTVDS